MLIPHFANSNNRLWVALLAAPLLLLVMTRQAEAGTCPDDRTNAIFTLNGVLTDPDEARANLRALVGAVSERMSSEEFIRTEFDFIYNENNSLGDLLEVILQSKGLTESRIIRTMEGLESAPELTKAEQDQLANLEIWDGNRRNLAAFQRLKDTVRNTIVAGKRVVVVAHSQGNLLANSAAADSTFLTAEQRRSYATVNVAVPDDRVQLSPNEYSLSDYITLRKLNDNDPGPHGDLVINPLSAILRSILSLPPPLPGNTPNEGPFEKNARTFNHNFILAYLARTPSGEAGPSRSEIATNTTTKIMNLLFQPNGGHCTKITKASCEIVEIDSTLYAKWLTEGVASSTQRVSRLGVGPAIVVYPAGTTTCNNWTGTAFTNIFEETCAKSLNPLDQGNTNWYGRDVLSDLSSTYSSEVSVSLYSDPEGLVSGNILVTDTKSGLSCPGTYEFP